MADTPAVHMGENSPEQVAYKLMRHIAYNEGLALGPHESGNSTANKQWILDTYAECLHTVQGRRSFK